MIDEIRELQDDVLTPDEIVRVDKLKTEEIAVIDHALLQSMTQRWQKVAMVVAKAMECTSGLLPDVPDVYFALRVRELVARRTFENRGNLLRMRYSEVRLPGASDA